MRCMKNIVYAVYHNLNTEARTMEILQGLRRLGKVHLISYAVPADCEDVTTYLINKSSAFALFDFLKTAKRVIKEVNPEWVFLHDNDCSALIPFIKKFNPNIKLIYDSSELYIKPFGADKNLFPKRKFIGDNGLVISLKGKLSSFRSRYEKKYLKEADVVIAANSERADIMKEYFSLKEKPIVFDNIHRIDDAWDLKLCEEKFKKVIIKGKFNILFAGGINEERKTFDYIDAVLKLGDGYNLVIAGNASAVALKKYNEMTVGSSNIHYVGFVDRATLRYCMANCQASVVIFDMNSYNTKYCASGKCYESLFESTPILASENPPLKSLCDTYKVGISNDNYGEAIVELAENYEYYKKSVDEYMATLSYETRVDRLFENISERLSK